MIKISVLGLVGSLVSIGSAPAVTLNVTELGVNDVVITEYLANPVGVADGEGEYFEIFNTTSATLDLAGLVVRDDGSNSFTIGDLSVAPRSFAVLSAGDGSGLGYTPDYVYGGAMALTNTDDEIALFSPDDRLIHKTMYDDGDAFGAGIANELAAVSALTPSITTGPSAGDAFVPALLALSAGNFGSPGAAGATAIDLPVVPLPASFWLFGGALAVLNWVRRRAGASQPGVAVPA